MQQQDLTGDLPCTSSCTGPGARKSAYHQRRGSSGLGTSNVTADESCAQAGYSSPASHQQCQGPGAQVKKKSGFQITSVTSAQINVSGNNSLADDTESYDDMDESHTEDLSSSDMLDVSASRATDTGVPGRSSSDETLNSLHGVDTPGLVSPNEHVHSHVPQVSLVNGTVNPHVSPQPHLHESVSVPGWEAAVLLPIAPLACSSPDVPKVGTRTPMLDNSKPAFGTHADLDRQSSVAPAAEPNVGVETPSTHSQYPQTQNTPGSRFRVVKLDTNSEPFRKGRWTCTEFYEKELPHSVSEAPKGLEVSAESEAANVSISAAAPFQSYQLPNQDISSAPVMKSSPQGLPQTAALSYVPVQKTLVPHILPQLQLPYAVDPHKPSAVYLQLSTGLAPDFIQPTAPFQSQVQPPLAHMSAGVPHTSAVPAQPSVSITQQLEAQTLGSPSPQACFPNIGAPSLQLQPQPLVQLTGLQGSVAPPPGAQVLPLTALQADLQPLLAPTANMRSSHLEDAHRLLFQHQGLLGLPRLGVPGASRAEGAMEGGNAGAALAHMGMSAEANAFMAAAAGLRSHADGEDDSSSSGASVVAIDNKIEQAMDLVKSHLMYAVREEVEVLKEQIKELIERNSQLEQENNLLKNLASPEQMALFQAQVQTGSSPTGPGKPAVGSVGTQAALPPSQNIGMSA